MSARDFTARKDNIPAGLRKTKRRPTGELPRCAQKIPGEQENTKQETTQEALRGVAEHDDVGAAAQREGPPAVAPNKP